MNKENTISKIKSLGRVGHVICTVAEVLVAIAFVMVFITTIVLGTIGKKGDIIKYQVSTKVNASIDLKGFIDKPSAEEAARIRESLSDGTLTVNGQAKNADVDFTDDGEITLKADGNSYSITQKAIVKLLVAVLVYMAFAFSSILFCTLLCKALKNCESPFDDNVIKKLVAFDISLIPWVILSAVSNNIFNAIISGGLINISVTVNFTMIFVVLFVFALTVIFKYGAELQKESDETL